MPIKPEVFFITDVIPNIQGTEFVIGL